MDPSNKHTSENHRIETLNRIAKYLKTYQPRDELDLDTIISIIIKMNHDASLRNIHRERLRLLDGVTNESTKCHTDDFIWNDADLFHENENNLLHHLINVVDIDFFYDIIQEVEDQNIDFIVNEGAIENLTTSLAIQSDGKKRKRRNIKLRVPVESNASSSFQFMNRMGAKVDIYNSRVVRNDARNTRRVTRRLAKDMRNSHTKEHLSKQ